MNQRIALAQPLALPTTDATLAPWLMATTATKKRTCTAAPRRGTVRSGAENTQQTAEILPDSEAFSRPKFTVASLAARGYGLDGRSGNARRTTVCVFSHPAHPLCLKSAESGFQQFKQELETMFASKGQTAPTLKAAPAIIPTTTDSASEVQAHALLQVVTSINLAGLYVRRDNIAQARRKLRQALQALSALEVQHA